MGKRALWWLGGTTGGAALIYWQLVVAEGAYLGPRAVRAVYSLGAAHYDAVRAPGQAAADALLLPLLQQALAHTPNASVLDVATGTGRIPRLLATLPGFAGRVAALDLTPPMLAQARHGPVATPAHVVWVVGEAGALPAPAARFDLVTCLEALEYFPRPRHALAEMAEALRPGATLIVSKWPDSWARLLPGRALSTTALRQALTALGLADLAFRPWQHGHYELVTARKL